MEQSAATAALVAVILGLSKLLAVLVDRFKGGDRKQDQESETRDMLRTLLDRSSETTDRLGRIEVRLDTSETHRTEMANRIGRLEDQVRAVDRELSRLQGLLTGKKENN